jgi:hypothetical protein
MTGRPFNAHVVLLIAAVLCSFHCGGRGVDDGGRPGPARAEGGGDQAIEITVFPRDGEVVRDLERPVVVEFSAAVEAADFTFLIEPDPGDWTSAWIGNGRRVELKHASPFLADTEYEVKVMLAPGVEQVVRFTAARPSSLRLIDEAEQASVIDPDTAWTYRLQFVFEPHLLPDEYRSSAPVHDVDHLMREFLRARDELSPETVAALRRYTVRPTHPDSVFATSADLKGAARSVGQGGDPNPNSRNVENPVADHVPRPDEMVAEECSEKLRLWSPRSQRGSAQELCRFIRQFDIYGRFTNLLGREPPPDTIACTAEHHLGQQMEHEACLELVGGDERLDIYLVSPAYATDEEDDLMWDGICITETELPNFKATTFVLVRLDPGSSTSDLYELTSTVAHEVFHSFQCAFDAWEDVWWEEATAVWSEEFINPQWDNESWLWRAFDITMNSQIKLDLARNAHEYAIYLFPYYLEKIDPGNEKVIAEIWKACEENPASEDENDSLTAIDQVLGGRFGTTLKDFSVVNLDRDLYEDRYGYPLDLFSYHDVYEWTLSAVGSEYEVTIWRGMGPLSANYDVVTNELDPTDMPMVRFRMNEIADSDELFLHAIIHYDWGVEEEDWSSRPERVFCINREEERFEKIDLILVSAEREKDYEFELANDIEAVVPEITVTGDPAPCLPTGGRGSFSITKDSQTRTHGPTDFTSHTQVSGQITFEPFDHKNGEFRGQAYVQLEQEFESHYADVRDEYRTRTGSGEVECYLEYPWGNEDAEYSLHCDQLDVQIHWRKVEHDPQVGEIVTTGEGSARTDIDEWCIRSHRPGELQRHQLDLTGSHNVSEPTQGGTRSESCTWNIRLDWPGDS